MLSIQKAIPALAITFICTNLSIVAAWCSPGQMQKSNGACTDCHPGFYMNEIKHEHTQCKPCPQLGQNEKWVEKCTWFSPGQTKCIDGFYRKLENCVPCTDCWTDYRKYEGVKCGEYKESDDTLCCASPTEMAFPDEHGSYECRETDQKKFPSHGNSSAHKNNGLRIDVHIPMFSISLFTVLFVMCVV